MRIADLPNPALDTETWLTSLEPWQRDGLLRIREALGVDADALLRAGVTIVLGLIGASADAIPPGVVQPQADIRPRSHSSVATSLPSGDPAEEEPGGGDG